jgi:DNA primase
MPYFGDDQVELVKQRTDLVQLIGEYTALKKSGANHKGCCIIHNERTPSMEVYEDGRFYCHGCQARGDCLDVIQQKEGMEFTEAVEFLAKRAGVVLVAKDGGKRPDIPRESRESLLEAVEFATGFYERQLAAHPEALDYLGSRGIKSDTILRFRLGWAPGRSQLVQAAHIRGIAKETLIAAGLATGRNDGIADFFFDRITFPICDRFSQPISLSCRLLPSGIARLKAADIHVGKYINGRDSALYHKGKVVWNLHRARIAAKTAGRILIMEGPTDVMMADQVGIPECVAVMGVRLTEDHLRQISNIVGTGRITLVFDGDHAGREAGEVAARTAMAAGIPLYIAGLSS